MGKEFTTSQIQNFINQHSSELQMSRPSSTSIVRFYRDFGALARTAYNHDWMTPEMRSGIGRRTSLDKHVYV